MAVLPHNGKYNEKEAYVGYDFYFFLPDFFVDGAGKKERQYYQQEDIFQQSKYAHFPGKEEKNHDGHDKYGRNIEEKNGEKRLFFIPSQYGGEGHNSHRGRGCSHHDESPAVFSNGNAHDYYDGGEEDIIQEKGIKEFLHILRFYVEGNVGYGECHG